ncbi:MAG: prolipoprotein diacylglyceryl transferase [Verrucomicrobiales bacterium]|nr:prolipoprotein diacylglyceryl transferase [Verrucomicrobiales bacterium]
MHKIAFSIGGFEVAWYGVLLAIGFLAGFWLAAKRAPRTGIDPNTVYDIIPWLLVASIAGARTLYVISYWKQDFANAPIWEVIMIRHGGLVYYGGLIGAIVGVMLFAWRKHVPLWKLADVLSPSIPVGYFFGRFGCLMNGCCYGRPTELPWGIHFPGACPDWPQGHPSWPNAVHPTQIYDSLLNLGLWVGLAFLYRRKKFDGQVFAAYLIAYAILRSIVEIFRGDYPAYYLGGLITPAQLLSAAIITAGIALYWYLSHAGVTSAAPTSKSLKVQGKL